MKTKIDAEAITELKPHQRDYEQVISEWECVLSWSIEHDEQLEVILARHKLEELQKRLAQQSPPPIRHEDRLWIRFRPSEETIAQLAELIPSSFDQSELEEFRKAWADRAAPQVQKSKSAASKAHNGFITEIGQDEIKWADRIETQRKKNQQDIHESIGHWIEVYLARQKQRQQAGELAIGRLKGLQATMHFFKGWIGASTLVETISSRTLTHLHTEFLTQVSSKASSPEYAKDRLRIIRSFIRWLWEQEVLDHLPKNIDSNDLKISIPTKTPETMTLDEIIALLEVSQEKSRLYILLALNCGMTQKDISDLLQEDVAWAAGKITRKRSKTQKHANVPTVSYQLWPETFQLLKKYRSTEERVLLNQNGQPLLFEEIDPVTGKYRKNDNIKNAYDRARRKANVKKSYKILRKTSATHIKMDPRFRGLEDLFLGHAPSKLSERHYSATHAEALDEALEYLLEKYKVMEE